MNALIVLVLGLAAVFAERGARHVRRHHRLGPGLRSSRPAIRVPGGPRLLWAAAAGATAFLLWGPLLALLAAGSLWAGFSVRTKRRASQLTADRDEQLADAVRSMSSALRAGMSVAQATRFVEAESMSPLRGTLEAWCRSLEVGVPFDEAVDAWATAVGSEDARLVAGVLQLNRRSGGDLPAVLDQVALTLRERQAAAGEVRALTAQARLSGTILGVLPIGFFAFLWLTSRSEIEGAFRSPAGIGAVSLGLVLELFAFLWIRRLLEVR